MCPVPGGFRTQGVQPSLSSAAEVLPLLPPPAGVCATVVV